MVENQSDKRNRIIRAAVRTFARKGYHLTRVSDIAKEADVAYGLVYHYFKNKEEILNTIFMENWSLFVKILKSVDKNGSDLRTKLESVCSFLLEAHRDHPELIEVVILEVTRSSKFMEAQNLTLFREAFGVLERMIRKEKRRGRIRSGIDTRVACYMVFGSLETVLSGSVIKALDLRTPAALAKAKRTMVEMVLSGLLDEG